MSRTEGDGYGYSFEHDGNNPAQRPDVPADGSVLDLNLEGSPYNSRVFFEGSKKLSVLAPLIPGPVIAASYGQPNSVILNTGAEMTQAIAGSVIGLGSVAAGVIAQKTSVIATAAGSFLLKAVGAQKLGDDLNRWSEKLDKNFEPIREDIANILNTMANLNFQNA